MSATITKGTQADWGRLFLTPGSIPALASLPNPLGLDLLQIIDEGGDIVVNVNKLGVVTLFPSNGAGGGGSSVASKLGAAANYTILAAAGITNATPGTVIKGGNIGSFPTPSITGFPPGVVTAPYSIDNTDAAAAQAAALIAYNYYTGLSFTSLVGSINLSTAFSGGNVVTPGNYSFGAALMTTGLVLNGAGLYVFKGSSTINLASGQAVTFENGADPSNVVWLVGSSFTSVATSTMGGNILANTSITLGGGVLAGRALAGIVTSSGAVTIAAATTATSPGNGSGTTKQVLFGKYYTRLGQGLTNTLAGYFADVFSENAQLQDILQVTVQGGKAVYHLDHLGVAYYS
jgi:hypothetical protein